MKNTPRGCLTAGGAKPPRVTPYISIQLVSVCKHSNWGYKGRGAPFLIMSQPLFIGVGGE